MLYNLEKSWSYCINSARVIEIRFVFLIINLLPASTCQSNLFSKRWTEYKGWLIFVYADARSGCMEQGGPAGVDSTLTFENSDNMMELPIINYDQKQVWNGPLPGHRLPRCQNESPCIDIRIKKRFIWKKSENNSLRI